MYREVGEAVIAGLGIGGIYAMIAMGYTLILSASGVFNFAQGSAVMGGTLAVLGLWQIAHIQFLLVVVILVLGGFLLGVLTHLITVFPVTNRRGVRNLTEGTLVTTFGFGLVLNTIAGMTFGYTTVPVNSYVTRTPVDALGLQINPLYLVMIAVTVVLTVVMELVLRRTRTGIMLRATASDSEGAQLAGVKVSTVVLVAFGIAGALAVVAGALLAPISFATVSTANTLVLLGFAGMAIGGFGSFTGALAGGLVVGLISTVVPVFTNSLYVDLIIYGAMIMVLMVRPQGLFGVAGRFGAAGLREI